MIKFEIKAKLPSLNDHIDACKANRNSGNKLKQETDCLIGWFIRQQVKTKVSSPVVVQFTWYENTYKRDKDNVAFAKKYILDALQKMGVLPNDNNKFILGFNDRFVYQQGQKVVVELFEQ